MKSKYNKGVAVVNGDSSAFFRYRHAQVLGFGAVAARAPPPQRHKPLPKWLFYAVVFFFAAKARPS